MSNAKQRRRERRRAQYERFCVRKISNIHRNNPTRTSWISDIPIEQYGSLRQASEANAKRKETSL